MLRRALLPGLIFTLLLVASLVLQRGEFLALALPLAAYLVGSLWQAPGPFRADVQRQLSVERSLPGQPVQVSVTVENHGPGLSELLVQDELPPGLSLLEGAVQHLVQLPRQAKYTFHYTIAGQRGHYELPAVRLSACDPTGLAVQRLAAPAGARLLVVPQSAALKSIVIRPRHTRVYAGQIPARLGGSGTDFYGVRDYQESDPPHWINWRASARHASQLYSNEFEQERAADVGLILDGRLRSNLISPGHSLFEYSVNACASLAEAFLSQGNRVGLLLYARYLEWTYPGYGRRQRERLLRALAQARTGASQIFADLDHIPTRLFPINSQLVLVSPVINDDLEVLVRLHVRGYRLIVVSPNPVAFELAGLPNQPEVAQAGRILALERGLLIQRLKHAGIQVVDWQVSQPIENVVQQALGHSPAWLRAIENIL